MALPEEFGGQVAVCMVAGGICFVLMMLSVLAGKVWAHTWAWIDDGKPGRNPVLELMARLRGWTPYTTEGSGQYLWWKDKKGESQPDVLLFFFPIAILGPLVAFLSLKFYPLLLTVLTLAVIAYVARFARRHRKLFDKHLKDPEAHK
ncbi:hypothetical protein [Pseudomonas sp. CFBP 13719]|uniref:hypothetical protein n=1 Tax=Pseudomonas sp. CFBP 13719 TaxID=2775303 RepID=UPI00177B067B|nr:hypothetical protein [Pseudomonas sp. CFBP 13719]MBD8680330.1 hypothetical protein [Pseudomonas sp. CFBP 13719]